MAMIYKRLIDFYQIATTDSDGQVGEIWQTIIDTSHAPLVLALQSRNETDLMQLLHTGQLLRGIEAKQLLSWNEERGRELLNSLGRRLGIVPVYNPEQPSPNTNWIACNPIHLQHEIEAIIGELDIPSTFGRIGIREGGASITALSTLAQCATLRMLLPGFPERILEIGPGIALFGTFARRFGAKHYVTIDLPSTAVIGAYNMFAMFGQDDVFLCGEPNNKIAFARVYPSTRFSEASCEYDLVVNINSLPEMPHHIQNRYLEFIRSCLASGGLFYSVNHESNHTNQRSVPIAVANAGGFRRIYRAPFMLRNGWIEELYKVV